MQSYRRPTFCSASLQDLLFAGDTDNGGQNRGDNLPRQWLTRLYYMAHSPFEITWALDSNVACCTRMSATAFLQECCNIPLFGIRGSTVAEVPRSEERCYSNTTMCFSL